MEPEQAKIALEEERRRLEAQLLRIARPDPAMPGEWEPLPPEDAAEPDILDQAELATSRDDTAGIIADLAARLANVNAALSRLEDGTYGTCEACGSKIEKERLAADPAATTCLTHR